MVDLNEQFDATTVEPNDFELLPNGKYIMTLVESEKRTSQNSGDDYVSLEFEIQGGQYEGRKLWLNLSLWSSNPKAVTFARSMLSSLCHAAGVLNLTDTSQLEGIPVVGVVKQKLNKQTNEMQNQITKFESRDGAVTKPQKQGTAQSATENDTPPWQG